MTFLDVLINRICFNEIETRIYRKKSNTDIYINWYSHAPLQWKIGTVRNLITRASVQQKFNRRSFKPQKLCFATLMISQRML